MNIIQKEFVKNAIDLVIERACGGMNGEEYLANIADLIDPDREMSKEKRMAELYFMASEVKREVG